MEPTRRLKFVEPVLKVRFMEESAYHRCPQCTDEGCPEWDALVSSIKEFEERFNERSRVGNGA